MKDWDIELVLLGCLAALFIAMCVSWIVLDVTGDILFFHIRGYSAILFMLMSWILAIDVLIAHIQDKGY